MNSYFEIPMTVKSSQCDSITRLRPSAVLEILQDLAEFHAVRMGISAPVLTERDGAYWILSKTAVRFDGELIQGENVTARTWPSMPSGFRCHRQYTLKRDGDGAPAVSATSEWVLMDVSTRKLRSVETTGYPLDMKHIEDVAMENPFSRMRDSLAQEDKVAERTIASTFIDLPHHTNNIVYCNIMLDTFTVYELEKMNISSLEIHYLHETLEGEKIAVYRHAEPDGFRFAIRREDGTTAVLAYMKCHVSARV